MAETCQTRPDAATPLAASEPAAGSPIPAGPATVLPAGFWIRAAALGIDYGVIQLVRVSVRVAARLLWGDVVESSRVFGASAGAFRVLFAVLYLVLFHWLWGQTFGKMAVGIRVVTMAGERLSLGTAVRREAGFAVSALALGLGFVMAGVRADKRALHDLLAGTRVERRPK